MKETGKKGNRMKKSRNGSAVRLFYKDGAYGIRTHGLHNANVARSQLR